MKTNKFDLIVIGGGASGMMTAISAATEGASVCILEKMERLGRKINISGKGRCNVTNQSNSEELMKSIARNGRFLYSAFSQFDGYDAMSFFESLGVSLKTERGNRVFPVSDSAFDITNALEKRCKREKVKIFFEKVNSIFKNDDDSYTVKTDKEYYFTNNVALCTGGLSYPGTGSTGDGYHFAESLGHTIQDLRPSLIPLCSPDSVCKDLQGISLKNVALRILDQKKKTVFSDFGELIFTHFGLSGPIVLSASAHLDWKDPSYWAEIDLKPALTDDMLDQRLLRDLKELNNKENSTLLRGLLPSGMISSIAQRAGIPLDHKCNSMTKEQRMQLIHTLKHFSIEINGTRPLNEAIVTRGGISIKEVNPSTMESKICRGLYFAGEILDVDAYTGGFNLQIAWATGRLAGISAARKE